LDLRFLIFSNYGFLEFLQPSIANPKSKSNHRMRVVGIIIGLLIAAIGGVIAYRALFIEPGTSVVITDRSVRELPNTLRVTSGIILLILGASVAYFAARRKPM
jgi:hypothetical protein